MKTIFSKFAFLLLLILSAWQSDAQAAESARFNVATYTLNSKM